MSEKAVVLRRGLLGMQVCVPKDWSDSQIKEFADKSDVAGTTNGWQIRRQGDALLAGASERVVCASREGYVHVMLDC
jgi:hypothetical protein